MTSHETRIWILVAILLVILALLIGITFTTWYHNLTAKNKIVYWVIGGLILLILIVIILILVFRRPPSTNPTIIY